MGNTTSSCRGYGQGALAMFVVIFLVAMIVAIVDWQTGTRWCGMNLSRCARILIDIVLVVLSLAGILYLSALSARCKCEGSSTCNEFKLDVPEE